MGIPVSGERLAFELGVDAQRRTTRKLAELLLFGMLRSVWHGHEQTHAIWQAETRADAEKAFDLFLETYEPKYPKATVCLQKDREELLAFYGFPAPHWQSIRTTNPIESTFATIRHRARRSRGCLTRDGMLHMMFKLGQCAEWFCPPGMAHF